MAKTRSFPSKLNRAVRDAGHTTAAVRSRAQEEIWNAFFKQMRARARSRTASVRAADASQLALSAVGSLVMHLAQNDRLDIKSANDAQLFLFNAVRRRAKEIRRTSSRQKNGGGHVQSMDDRAEKALTAKEIAADMCVVYDEYVAQLAEREAAVLGDGLQGYTTEETAARLKIAPRTVELARASYRLKAESLK